LVERWTCFYRHEGALFAEVYGGALAEDLDIERV
jgi:hypothetical protein